MIICLLELTLTCLHMWVVPVMISNDLFGGADAEVDGGGTFPSGVVGHVQSGADR